MRSRTPLAFALVLTSFACGDDSASTAADGSTTSTSSSPTSTTTGTGGGGGAPTAPTVRLPKMGLEPSDLGVLVNVADPQSVEVAAHYVTARGIPQANVIEVEFPVTGSDNMTKEVFDELQAKIDAAMPSADIQAFAVTWTYPTRVECMSLTTALAFRKFDTGFCNTSGGACGETLASDYYDSESVAPFTDLGVRPAMVLAGATAAEAIELIDRGVAADDTFPGGNGWFVRTTDEARSVRWQTFEETVDDFSHPTGLTMTYVDNSMGTGLDYIENERDVLFYFTGLTSIPALDTLTFRPGAAADHLTSFGGSIPAVGQMNVVAWLEAGATGSFGTLQEPCNYTQKFPDPEVMVPFYFRGNTLIEAYWKSVQWPGEGLFVGEPLARPWGRSDIEFVNGTLTITTTMLKPGQPYELRAADAEDGPYTTVLSIPPTVYERATITLENATAPFYELVLKP